MSHDKIASPLWLVTQSIHDPSFLHFCKIKQFKEIIRKGAIIVYQSESQNLCTLKDLILIKKKSFLCVQSIMESLECVKFICKFLSPFVSFGRIFFFFIIHRSNLNILIYHCKVEIKNIENEWIRGWYFILQIILTLIKKLLHMYKTLRSTYS